MNTQKLLTVITFIFLLNFFWVKQSQAQYTVVKLGTSSVGSQQWGELLVGKSFTDNSGGGMMGTTGEGFAMGWAAGLEWTRSEVSPKVSLGAIIGEFVTSSLNVNYFPKRDNRVVFTPEIGLSLGKVIHVTYGYQFNQVSLKESNPHVNKNRISVFLTMPFGL